MSQVICYRPCGCHQTLTTRSKSSMCGIRSSTFQRPSRDSLCKDRLLASFLDRVVEFSHERCSRGVIIKSSNIVSHKPHKTFTSSSTLTGCLQKSHRALLRRVVHWPTRHH
eukprot:Blabericola_migrator_1__96@NODE_1023_length_5670_cov_79_506336_g703_i0_p4_GENE_NODE_1023_length_5670_cov_79_506336_g703_i0NODE_1023_length_5670_cov_79_506336_g703_i0_p4_ORF_typecomplete_len111_score6_91BEN/PF10523_9/0_034_NODE_1023_length_5670_cov_79_506336_g703_i046745006